MRSVTRKFTLMIAAVAACIGAGVLAAGSGQAATPIAAFTTKGAFTFVSAPNLHPPKISTDVPTSAKQLAPGYFMVANFKNLSMTQPLVGQGGPLILDRNLQPVLFDPAPDDVYSLNLAAQTLQGKPVLSWWEGDITPVGAVLSGEDLVVNQHYRTVATLEGADGWTLSPHEFLIRGDDAWVTAYKNVPMNLSAEGGSADGTLVDSAVQEYSLKTHALLFSWDAAAHIPLADSETRPAPAPAVTPWDAYHVNSINLTSDGMFVASMRSTWAAYLVDIRTGSIVWTLGGKASSFTVAANAQFQWQHDVDLQPGGEVSLFDDACCAVIGQGVFAPPSGPSRGLVLKLNTTTHTATLIAQYTHSGLETSTQGSMQILSNGNVLVGWGQQPWFSEYSKSGKLLFDARFPDPDISYRTYLEPWVGTPYFPPSGAARKVKGKVTVYASWDGATQVVAWRVMAGSSAKHMSSVVTTSKRGFETAIKLKTGHKVYEVRALDAKGHVIGTSKDFSVPKAAATTPPPPTGFY